MSKKRTVYDSTLVNQIRLRANDYKTITGGGADVDSYLHNMLNPAGFDTPDNYGAGDHIANAFYDWNLSRNEVNKDSSIGNYVYLLEDYETLTQSKEYLNNIRDLLNLNDAVQKDPSQDTPENKLRLQELAISSQRNRLAYDKLLSGNINDSALQGQVNPERFARNPISILIESIDSMLGADISNTGIKDTRGLIARRDQSLVDAEKYQANVDYWNGKLQSDYYNYKKSQPGMDLTDIDTYLYKVPGLLGSSAASMGSLIIGTLGAWTTSSGKGGALGTLGGVYAAVAGNMNARDLESKAEVYQNYKTKLINSADNAGLSKSVLKEARTKLRDSGLFTEDQLKDDNFVYDLIIQDKVKVDNVKFNKLRVNNLNGLNSLYMDNMALGIGDVAQTFLEVTPLGKIASNIKGTKKLAELANSRVGRAAQLVGSKYGGIKQQLADRIDDVVGFGIDNVGKLPKLATRKKLLDLGGRIVLTSAMEGAEEGVQYIKGQRYIDGQFEKDPSLIGSYVKNLGTGLRSVYAAITPWDPVYSDDQEFMDNFKGGALLGGLTTAVVGGISTIGPLTDQIEGDKFVSALYADGMLAKDLVKRNIDYGRRIRTGKWDLTMAGFDDLEQAGIDGIDSNEVITEKERANRYANLYTSNKTLSKAVNAGIDPRTSEYDAFVALTDYHDGKVVDTRKARGERKSVLDTLLYGQDVINHINDIKPEATIDEQIQIRDLINLKSSLDAAKRIKDKFADNQSKLTELEANTKINTSKASVNTFNNAADTFLKDILNKYDQEKGKLSSLGITEDQLEVPRLHNDIKDAQDNLVHSELEVVVADSEQKQFNTNFGIRNKLDAYNKALNKDENYVQQLNDRNSGKEQEINEEEVTDINIPQVETAPESKPEVTAPQPEVKEEGSIESEDPSITSTRQSVQDIQKSYFREERDSRGNNKKVLNPDNDFGKAYKHASDWLKSEYNRLLPGKKQYFENSAENNLSNLDSQDAENWSTLFNLRNRMEEAVYEQGDSLESRNLLNSIYSTLRSFDESALEKELTQLKQKIEQDLKNSTTELVEDTQVQPIPEQVLPSETTPEETPLLVAPEVDLPTLGSLLGGLIGEEGAQALDSNQPDVEPVPEAPEAEPRRSAPEQPSVVVDPRIDPISHQLNYKLTTSTRDSLGRWVREPKKYQGMDNYLNNDDFAQVSANLDFVEEVTKNGVEFKVSKYTDAQGISSPAIYAIFKYKGKEYIAAVSTVEGLLRGPRNSGFNSYSYDRQQIIILNLKDLRTKILNLHAWAESDKNIKIVPTQIRTTSGVLVNEKNQDGSPKNRSLLNSAWLTEKNPYNITPDNVEIGITTGPQGGNVVRLRDRNIHASGYPMGQPLWFIKVNKNEKVNEIPVKLNYRTFKEDPEVADLIIDLLVDNNNVYTDKKGTVTNIDPKNLLRFLVNFGSHTAVNTQDPKFTQDQIARKLVKQFFIDENNNVFIGPVSYNIGDIVENPVTRQYIKQYIMDNFHYSIDEDGLTKNYLGGDLQSKVRDPHFAAVSTFLKNSNVDNIVILPGKLEFSIKDFGITKDAKGNKVVDNSNPNGLSVLGWYIKQGILQTDIADNLVDANIYFDDVTTVDTSKEQVIEKAQQKVEKQQGLVFDVPSEDGGRTIIDVNDLLSFFDGNEHKGPNMSTDNSISYNQTVEEIEQSKDRLTTAKTWLKNRLGLENVEIVDSIIDITEAGAYVVGRATEDSILLSEFAPRGVEYHEAWHRVSLLLITDKTRRKIYDRYNKRNKANYTDTQIDEILAEDYREYMLNAENNSTAAFKYDFETTNWFKKIYDFIKLWIKTGQYGLAKIITDINTGKFYGVKPSQENVERFREIYKDGANLEVNGFDLKTISTLKQLDNIIKSLTYAFFRVDFTNSYINYSDLATDKPRFDRLKLVLEAQATRFPSPVINEIVERFDDVFAPSIAIRLKQLGIRTIDSNESDTISNIEEGAEGVNIGQHTVEGMNVSIKDNAPAEVKFFFQTVPQYEMDSNGKIQTVQDPYTHFPMFVDSKRAWDKVLKDLAGCRTIRNIITKVSQLGQNDLFYRALLGKFNDLAVQYRSSDPKVSTNAEAMFSKLLVVLTSDINNFITVKIGEDRETGVTSMQLIDNTVDTKAAKYPKIWSQALFNNSGIFRFNEDGAIVATPNAKKRLQSISNGLGLIYNAFHVNRGILKVGDIQKDLRLPENIEYLKDAIVAFYNAMGILIDKPTINTMLQSGQYGKPSADAYTLLDSFVTRKVNFGGLSKLINILDITNKAIKQDGTVGDIEIDGVVTSPRNLISNNGYVKVLANFYSYTHATDKGLSSLGAEGNTYYMVSQNNFAKDRVSELLTDSQLVNQLSSVEYNKGSLLLKSALQGNKNIAIETFINFKDATTYDVGRDYFGITDREDYLAKMAAVFEDRIIFPTVADKKTYHFIRGVALPHEQVNFTRYENGGTIAQYGEESLDTLLNYCYDELNQIELTLRQIDDDPSHLVNGIHYNEDGTVNNDWLEPSRRIKNFHTPNKVTYTDGNGKKVTKKIEGNGSRFLFLIGIYTDKGFVNFNDPKKSAKENLQKAKDYFFDLPRESQKLFLSGIISERVKQEVITAKALGLIESNDNNNIWSLRNNLLDGEKLAERISRYQALDPINAEGYAIWDMLADYTINSIISINETEKVFSGAPAYYKVQYNLNGLTDIAVDKIKRLGSLTSTGANNRLEFPIDPINPEYSVAELKDHEIRDKQYYVYEGLFYRGNIKEAIILMNGFEAWNSVKDLSIQELEKEFPEATKVAKQAAAVEVEGYKSGVNVADAAVYISPNMFRDLMRMQGNWNSEIKEAFEVLTNEETADKWQSDPELYAKANKTLLNALKYMAFGNRLSEIPGLSIPYFNKMALFPLFKSVATGDLKALYDRMVDANNPLDMVMFNSAVKAGSRAPMAAYRNAEDSEIELKDGQTVLSARITDELADEEGNTLNDFNNLVVYKLNYKYLRQQLATDPHTHEEQMAGTQFMKVNLSNLFPNDMYGKVGEQVTGREIKETVMSALNKLSDLGKEKLAAELLNENGDVNITKLGKTLLADARESDANDNVISGLKTKDDAFVIPLSALSDNKWIESRFISMINKRIIDVNLPGGAFIQRSTFGLEATQQSVVTPDMINDGRQLKLINEEGSMDAVVSINLFKHIIPNYKKLTFTQAKQWLIDNNIIGDNAMANSIGYRIPTQSVASISALRFVDVFPEIMGDTIMLPEGFTKLTGSDFDIDKLYVARMAYDSAANVITDGENGIKNDLMNAYLKVLLTKENTNQLKLSIDNATGNVKAVLKDIESGRGVQNVSPFEVYSPTYQEARKSEYTGGKAGIGPFALNNAHHILTLLTGIKMVSNAFTQAMDITDLGRVYDYPTSGNPKGGRILDWLSAMINGFVDIAKDPYIVRLNVNAWTYNMVSFLLRTGKGAQTFYFMGQPILKEMADEVIKTKGKYGIDRTKSPSQLENEAIQKVLDKYDPTKKLREKYEFINKDVKTQAIEYADLFTTFDLDGKETSRMRQLLKVDREDSRNFNDELVRVYYAWKALKPYADDLANLVKYSKIDTKKTGKSFVEQANYYEGMDRLAQESNFADGEVDRFYNETFIRRKTDNSIPFGISIFKDLLLRNTESMQNQMNITLSFLGRKGFADPKLLNSLISGMESQVKTEFFNQTLPLRNLDFVGMFKGKDTMAKRLNNLKQKIYRGESEYKHLLNSDGTITNDFLQYLLPNIDNDNLDFIDTSELLAADQAESNNLISYWGELLEDVNPEIKKFAEDLVVYSFYQSGDNFGMNSFFQFVPNSYRLKIGYTDFIQGKLDQLKNSSAFAYSEKADLMLNNWHNDKIVRPVDMYKGKDLLPLKSLTFDSTSPVPHLIYGQRFGQNFVDIRPIGYVNTRAGKYPLFPPFIKMKDTLGYKPENWHVYALVGYSNTTDPETMFTTTTPVYGLVDKKGYKYRGHTIVEYGKETSFEFNKETVYDYVEAMNNPDALVDMADQYSKDEWNEIAYSLRPITELPSYQNMNYAKLELDRISSQDDENIAISVEDDSFNAPLEEPDSIPTETEPTTRKTYSGLITKLKENQVFVFGSNTLGRHGKGAALIARKNFGAIYGQSEGIQGNSFAIITKDLTKNFVPSRTDEQIKELISKLYQYAKENPDKEFLVAYSSTGTNLNGLENQHLADLFAQFDIPSNIVFETGFNLLVMRQQQNDIADGSISNTWSKKEGWSEEYFSKKVLPKINEAWQIEYKLAPDQRVNPDLQGSMNYSYGENKRAGLKSNTTLEAIANGERTATTRYESDGNIDYWKKAKVGDIINFHNKTGESVKVIVTNPLTKLVVEKIEPIQLNLFEQVQDQPLTGIDLMALYNKGEQELNIAMSELNLNEEQLIENRNNFSKGMTEQKVDTEEKLQEYLRKFICNL